eukprot:EC724987.1.p1 GENE.EC724987.1~~EC724987.1.p1  ORF type:complete len:196 (+),score=15.64 EC724987.1:63-650(+)
MEHLALLLNAPSKKAVDEAFVECFQLYSNVPASSLIEQFHAKLSSVFNVTKEQAGQLVSGIREIIRVALYSSMGADEVARVIPPSVDDRLKSLVAQIVTHHLGEWRDLALQTQPAFPRLLEFDWRADVKTSSHLLSRMAAPTLLVQLKVQPTPERAGAVPEPRSVVFETTRETLDTVLERLGRIRDQLQAVRGSS